MRWSHPSQCTCGGIVLRRRVLGADAIDLPTVSSAPAYASPHHLTVPLFFDAHHTAEGYWTSYWGMPFGAKKMNVVS